jgi:hypothetical protein
MQAVASPLTSLAPLQVDLDLSEVSLVVCNDRPNSFGAPDVLQAVASGVALRYHCDQQLPDHPAEYGTRLQLAASVNFLNNSSSRWAARAAGAGLGRCCCARHNGPRSAPFMCT